MNWNTEQEPRAVFSPSKPDNLTDGVIVPSLQALITGVLFGLAVGVLAALAGVPAWYKLGAGALVLGLLLPWLAFRSGWERRLEALLGLDLNRDGMIGAQPAPPVYTEREPVRVVLSQRDGREVDFLELPASREQLTALADGLSAGRSFSLTAWTGSGAPFSRAEFERLRDELLRRNLARWRNPSHQAQGIELLASGKAILKRFASDTSSLSPTLRAGEPRE